LVDGFIQFTLGGGNETRPKFGSQTIDASKDENSVIFVKKQMPAFAALRAEIENAIANLSGPSRPAAPDHLAQLRQLAELRDSGVVSEAEFNAKKAEILGRL
jgi:hypothetical protein